MSVCVPPKHGPLQLAFAAFLFAASIHHAQSQQEFIISKDGSLTIRGSLEQQSMSNMVCSLGLPSSTPTKRWREKDVLRTIWRTNSIEYTQTVLLSRLNGSAQTNLWVLLVNVHGLNTDSEYRDAYAGLSIESDSKNFLPLELRQGFVWADHGSSTTKLAALDVPESGVKVARGGKLQFHGFMPPSIDGSFTLKVPLFAFDDQQTSERLQDLDFQTALRHALKQSQYSAIPTVRLLFSEAVSGQTQPTVEELLRKVAERAKQQNAMPPKREFIRTKTTLELDKKHNIKEREDLTYRMAIVNGKLYPRLILKNGKALTPREQAKEEDKEDSFKKKHEGDDKSAEEEGNTVLLRLNEETVKRFNYEITGREEVNSRSAYVVTVTPKEGIAVKGIEEEVMAQMSGRIWIDEGEYEIAKVEVHLMKPVHFGVVGVLGALHELDFNVFRNRHLEGDWENSVIKVWLQFRIFLDTKRFRYEERISELPTE